MRAPLYQPKNAVVRESSRFDGPSESPRTKTPPMEEVKPN